MFVPRKKKYNHIVSLVSRKTVNTFIVRGLKIISANPAYYFHQTLTFPRAIVDAKEAKTIFNTCIKSVLDSYQKNELAVFYVQERRKKDSAIHFHVCFLFLSDAALPFSRCLMYREFRKDIFLRWNKLNGSKAVHAANQLKERHFNLDSLNYFAGAVTVADSTNRAETNWCGLFNGKVIESRSTAPTKQEKKAVFDYCFKKPLRRRSAIKTSKPQEKQMQTEPDLTMECLRTTEMTLDDCSGHLEKTGSVCFTPSDSPA